MIFHYLSRLYDTIYSRSEIKIEYLCMPTPSRYLGRIGARLRFYDGSLLELEEEVTLVEEQRIAKVYYKYHYQRADGSLVFRYDNAPHHPQVSTFSHHKHVDDRVEPAEPPDLSHVLREIDSMLYG
jgi:hypothetical protein